MEYNIEFGKWKRRKLGFKDMFKISEMIGQPNGHITSLEYIANLCKINLDDIEEEDLFLFMEESNALLERVIAPLVRSRQKGSQ